MMVASLGSVEGAKKVGSDVALADDDMVAVFGLIVEGGIRSYLSKRWCWRIRKINMVRIRGVRMEPWKEYQTGAGGLLLQGHRCIDHRSQPRWSSSRSHMHSSNAIFIAIFEIRHASESCHARVLEGYCSLHKKLRGQFLRRNKNHGKSLLNLYVKADYTCSPAPGLSLSENYQSLRTFPATPSPPYADKSPEFP